MELKSLTAVNFLSFRELQYEFQNGEPILILGQNLTDDSQESNGSGKSAMVSAIEFCIQHQTSQNVNDSDLINWEAEQSELSLSIFCPIRNETMLIERIISTKNSGMAQLSFNGVVKFSFEDKQVREIDRLIIEWIGISKEDLQNFYILSKFKYTSFFKATNTALINLIGRFSNSNIIAGIDKDIMNEALNIENDRLVLIENKNKLFGMIEVHEANLLEEQTIDRKKLVEDALQKIDDSVIQYGEKIIELNTNIGISNKNIEDEEELLIECLESLQKTNLDLKAAENKNIQFDEDYKNIDSKIILEKEEKEKFDNKLQELNKDFATIVDEINTVDLNIRGSVTCPKCQHEFVVGKEDVNVEEEKELKKSYLELSAELTLVINETKENINSFDPKLRELKQERIGIEVKENEFRTMKRNLSNSIVNIEKEKNAIDSRIQAYQSNIELRKQSIKSLSDSIKELEESKLKVTVESFDNKDRIKAIQENIENCKEQIKEVEIQDKELIDKIFDKKQWAFTFKEFTQYLSVKTLKVLQGYSNKFLEDMHSDLRVELSGYAMKKDGTLSDKITANIIRNGESKEFGNFSGGERARLEMGAILMIQHAVNSTHPYGGLNFLSIDEILESCDSQGLNSIINSLIPLHKSILLTTHVAMNNFECKVLNVVKEHGISKIQ